MEQIIEVSQLLTSHAKTFALKVNKKPTEESRIIYLFPKAFFSFLNLLGKKALERGR